MACFAGRYLPSCAAPSLVSEEIITHPTLVQLVAAGAVRVVVAVWQLGGWIPLVRYGLAERALAAQLSKQLRVFRKLDTLMFYLLQIGVSRF
ncbi:hypothetical protein WP8S18E11_01540 [Aeromonas veronii]|nr:hypothetical protein WP8S18E11_01540 [Aeromonas veronii]